MITSARLRVYADDSEFLFTKTHSADDSPSQEMSAPRVLERTALAASLPAIMVDDFESRTDDLAYPTLVEYSSTRQQRPRACVRRCAAHRPRDRGGRAVAG